MNPDQPTQPTQPTNPQHQPQENQKKKKLNPDQFSTYAKYTGLAFQLLATLGIAAWGGLKLDRAVGNNFPLLTILFEIIALTGSVFLLIRQLPKE